MKILVVGSSPGSTAALELKRKLKDNVEVTLIDRNELSVYSFLIWVTIKRRREVSEIIVPWNRT